MQMKIDEINREQLNSVHGKLSQMRKPLGEFECESSKVLGDDDGVVLQDHSQSHASLLADIPKDYEK